MGSINQGRSPNLPRWRVIARLRRWGLTCRAIGSRLGITRQAVHHCLQKYRQTRTKLSVPQILTWADAYHARTGLWPKAGTPRIPRATGLNWRMVDNALRLGLRGLPGGSSLAKLLAEHREVRNVRDLPPLTKKLILSWADHHHARTGKWPTEDSGEIANAPGEIWNNVDAALRQGLRGFPGGSSLAKLLAACRGVRNQTNIPRLTLKQILTWADSHHRKTGRWPRHDTGPIFGAPGETWLAVETALIKGVRGLPGGSSLYRVLKKYRRIPGRRPGLRKTRRAKLRMVPKG